jgi:WD40 repeat protein
MEDTLGSGFTFLDEPWKVLRQERRKPGPDKLPTASCDMLDLRRKDPTVLLHHEQTANPYFFPSTSSDGKLVAFWRPGEPEVKIFKVVGDALKDPLVLKVKETAGDFQISPDGSRFWAETAVYNTRTGTVLSKVEHKGLAKFSSHKPACWLGNSHMVKVMMFGEGAGGTDALVKKRSLVLWNVEDCARIHSVEAPDAQTLSASPDWTQLAEAGLDMKVRIRNAETLEVSRVLRVHDAPVLDVAWHPKSPLLATCSEDFMVRIWNLQTEELVQEFGMFAMMPKCLSWCPDGSRLSVQFSTGEVGLLTPKLQKP